MDRPATPTLAEELLQDVTDAMVEQAAGYREDVPAEGLETTGPIIESTPLPGNPRDTISQAGYDFVVRWETGGKAYYERVIKGRPVWPGYASGITIGCGYDLGYHRLNDFRQQWSARIPRSDFDRLAQTIGFRTTEPDRPAKIAQARALVQSLSDIVVSWSTAIEQFDNSKLPDLIRQLYQSLDHLDRLNPHCRSALLSLVFNRGAAFALDGDRFLEMREIAALMRNGTSQSFRKIPEQIRSMKRIWGPDSSLSERREGEAKLFEAGLREMHLFESIAAVPSASLESASREIYETHESVEGEQSDIADDVDISDEEMAGLEAAGLSPASVRWNPRDDEQPDYRRLDTRLANATFELISDDLDALVRANSFQPIAGKMIFALRGAHLVGGAMRENATAITLTDQRPDHRAHRCIIGVYDPQQRRIWAYQASTVPNARYVHKCYADFNAGTPIENLTGNILPTGFYVMTVGVHRAGTAGEIPGVLRLSTTATGASRVVVLRSLQDVMYDRLDAFPVATPADNVHPGQTSQSFSSAGCLTLPGFYSGGEHSGAWRDFRNAAGFGNTDNGKQFSLMLLTGLDAAIAARLRDTGGDRSALVRLRHGSKGTAVARLQTSLGLAPDASQLLGPNTRKALIQKQAVTLGWSDGIYSAAMDRLLGFDVF